MFHPFTSGEINNIPTRVIHGLHVWYKRSFTWRWTYRKNVWNTFWKGLWIYTVKPLLPRRISLKACDWHKVLKKVKQLLQHRYPLSVAYAENSTYLWKHFTLSKSAMKSSIGREITGVRESYDILYLCSIYIAGLPSNQNGHRMVHELHERIGHMLVHVTGVSTLSFCK